MGWISPTTISDFEPAKASTPISETNYPGVEFLESRTSPLLACLYFRGPLSSHLSLESSEEQNGRGDHRSYFRRKEENPSKDSISHVRRREELGLDFVCRKRAAHAGHQRSNVTDNDPALGTLDDL